MPREHRSAVSNMGSMSAVDQLSKWTCPAPRLVVQRFACQEARHVGYVDSDLVNTLVERTRQRVVDVPTRRVDRADHGRTGSSLEDRRASASTLKSGGGRHPSARAEGPRGHAQLPQIHGSRRLSPRLPTRPRNDRAGTWKSVQPSILTTTLVSAWTRFSTMTRGKRRSAAELSARLEGATDFDRSPFRMPTTRPEDVPGPRSAGRRPPPHPKLRPPPLLRRRLHRRRTRGCNRTPTRTAPDAPPERRGPEDARATCRPRRPSVIRGGRCGA